MQHTQAVACGMVRHTVRIISSHVFESQLAHEEFGELIDARPEIGDSVGENCIACLSRCSWIHLAYHPDAGRRWRHHHIRFTEYVDETAYERQCLVLVACVVVQLSAAGLLRGELDAMAQTL